MFAEGQSVSATDLLDHLLAEGLSRYDLPEFWLPQADIPLMPNGKMDKLEIVGRVRDGSLVPEPV
jgi:acyl-CoA synthetase